MAFNFYSTTGFNTQEVMRFDSNGNVGIGSVSPSKKLSMSEYTEYIDILEMAKTNTAVKLALERLRTTYYLSKDNGNSKT